jgi:flagellar hook assembly protein FlgD
MESPELPAGYHQIAWNGTDDGGRAVPSGAYFCELSSGDWSATQKVLLIR